MSRNPKLTVLFLGAGKRLSLLEYFISSAAIRGIDIELMSIEKDLYPPIGIVAKVFKGPSFKNDEFDLFLLEFLSKNSVNIIIPNFDSATVALSRIKKEVSELGAWAVVSEYENCCLMEDKVLAEEYFAKKRISTPSNTNYPKIAKHRLGFGSRDQQVLTNFEEEDVFFANRKRDDYIVQDFLEGAVEYTVDAYVDRLGRLIAALSRKRLAVSAGEVEISLSEDHPKILKSVKHVLSFTGWQGPITLQYLVHENIDPVLLEINPRFGGGVTHSLHLGLDMPGWILDGANGKLLDEFVGTTWKSGSLMTRCRRDVFYDNFC